MRPHAALLIWLCACEPDLGVCEDEVARALVYDEAGQPAYAGQALLHVSCGHGSYCHSAEATGRLRFGVPLGFDFDVAPVGDGDHEALARLVAGTDTVAARSRAIFRTVEKGDMPPWGEATLEIHVNAPRYRFVEGEGTRRLEHVDSFEGLEILRNWLACGAPVVERTEGTSEGVGDVIPALLP
jgi:hypothetical protein